MFKLILTLLMQAGIALYLVIVFIMPFQWYRIAAYSEIFPAFDLIVIFYFSTYNRVKYWHLFIIGLLVDQLYMLSIGTSPLAFLIANFGLNTVNKWFLLKNHFTNLVVFCGYSLFIIIVRYFIVTVKSTHHIEGIAVYFYFLTTIFSYPIICLLIEKPIKMVVKNLSS